eukprot:1008754_1
MSKVNALQQFPDVSEASHPSKSKSPEPDNSAGLVVPSQSVDGEAMEVDNEPTEKPVQESSKPADDSESQMSDLYDSDATDSIEFSCSITPKRRFQSPSSDGRVPVPVIPQPTVFDVIGSTPEKPKFKLFPIDESSEISVFDDVPQFAKLTNPNPSSARRLGSGQKSPGKQLFLGRAKSVPTSPGVLPTTPKSAPLSPFRTVMRSPRQNTMSSPQSPRHRPQSRELVLRSAPDSPASLPSSVKSAPVLPLLASCETVRKDSIGLQLEPTAESVASLIEISHPTGSASPQLEMRTQAALDMSIDSGSDSDDLDIHNFEAPQLKFSDLPIPGSPLTENDEPAPTSDHESDSSDLDSSIRDVLSKEPPSLPIEDHSDAGDNDPEPSPISRVMPPPPPTQPSGPRSRPPPPPPLPSQTPARAPPPPPPSTPPTKKSTKNSQKFPVVDFIQSQHRLSNGHQKLQSTGEQSQSEVKSYSEMNVWPQSTGESQSDVYHRPLSDENMNSQSEMNVWPQSDVETKSGARSESAARSQSATRSQSAAMSQSA